MCTTCGCSGPKAHGHGHDHDHEHEHEPEHAHEHHPGEHHEHGEEARRIRVERDILSKNDAFARANREQFARHGIFALNLVSSPGSGKTTLLVRTIEALRGRVPVAVIEGDQQTSMDADRIRAAGAPAVQINTGKGCHLDAHAVGHAVADLHPSGNSILLIENVGNLVCPAAFDLGEAFKVVVLSVTEGEDKPLKYPDMFRAAQLMVLNKIDLLPHLQFDVSRALDYARRVNPALQVIGLSATTGEGFELWLDWIAQESAAWRRRQAGLDRLQRQAAA